MIFLLGQITSCVADPLTSTALQSSRLTMYALEQILLNSTAVLQPVYVLALVVGLVRAIVSF